MKVLVKALQIIEGNITMSNVLLEKATCGHAESLQKHILPVTSRELGKRDVI